MTTAEDVAGDAEKALLGAAMLSPTAMWTALDEVTAADFHDPKHAILFEVIEALAHEQHEADPIGVVDELLKRGDIIRVPADYVHTLTSVPTTPSSASYYADIVLRHATLRRARTAADRLLAGIAEGGDVLALTDEARRLLEPAAQGRTIVETIGTGFLTLAEELEHPPLFRPTPWPHLNNYIDGLMPDSVYVIAARPGAGKSIVGLQLAKELAKHGPVSFHSLEMPRGQLLRRLLASESDVSMTTLSRHTVSKDDWLKIAPARTIIEAMPLHVDDRSGVTLTQIEAYARRVAREGKLSGIVVDYLQLIPSTDPRKPRWEHIGELTRGLKLLAKDLHVPVILLSQLNRESEKNRRLPTLADLRESGSIEQDADVVLLMQRRADKEGNMLDEIDIVIAKNRHGQMGRIELEWQGKYSRLMPMRAAWATPTVDYQAMRAGDD